MLQKRWESLLSQGRRVIIVGDLNIAPAAIDRCDAEPGFEKNMYVKTFVSRKLKCSFKKILTKDIFNSEFLITAMESLIHRDDTRKNVIVELVGAKMQRLVL